MNDAVLSVLSKVEDLKLRSALYNLVDSVKKCSKEELRELHKAGRLPEGCMKFILCVRDEG